MTTKALRRRVERMLGSRSSCPQCGGSFDAKDRALRRKLAPPDQDGKPPYSDCLLCLGRSVPSPTHPPTFGDTE